MQNENTKPVIPNICPIKMYHHGIPHCKREGLTETIEALYQELLIRKDNGIKADLQFRIYALAKEVLGSRIEVLGCAYSSGINMGLGVSTVAFIEDTVNFIAGQPRSLNVYMWEGMLDAPTNRLFTNFVLGIASRVGPITPVPFATVKCPLLMWASRPNGFEDMLCTMRVLFGNAACK